MRVLESRRMQAAGFENVLVGDLAAQIRGAPRQHREARLGEPPVFIGEFAAILSPCECERGGTGTDRPVILDRGGETRHVAWFDGVRFVQPARGKLRARSATNPAAAH